MSSSTRAGRRPSNSSACRPQSEPDCPQITQITQIHPIENNVGPPTSPFQTADYADRRRSLPTTRVTTTKTPRHQGAVAEPERRSRISVAERQSIGDRLPQVRSSRGPNASIRRRCASHRPTCQRHVGSASFLFLPNIEWTREGARPALSKRRPLGREPSPEARFRSGFPTQRFPAVRRPGPRHMEQSSEVPSAS